LSSNRREILQVGFSTALGLGLRGLAAVAGDRPPHVDASLRDAGASLGETRPRGRAKRVILVFQTGGASHIDTLDPKPAAPDAVRGEFKPIATRVSGIQIGEHMPLFAARADRWAIIRSMSHRCAGHLPATHQVLTGSPIPGLPEDRPDDKVASRQDWPCYAAALSYLRPRHDGIPSGVSLPTFLLEGPLTWPGQHAGLLGGEHDPWQIRRDPNDKNFREDTLRLVDGLSLERLQNRRSLLAEVDRQRTALAAAADAQQVSARYESAFNLLTSGRLAQAFDLGREPAKVRDRYGRHMFGQSLLLARRLAEAGVPIVQCNLGIVQTWDNHADIFNTLKKRLLPPLDQGLAALLDDLQSGGLLDETLVVLFTEFGRTPKIARLQGQPPGRDHWPQVFSVALAGAGVRGGQVIGSSDAAGAYPASTAYSPRDLGATIYDALGLRPDTVIHDRLGRPLQLCSGDVIAPLYSGKTA
jgi:hypothetical protein